MADAYFTMQTVEQAPPFVVKLSQQDLIDHARRILSGAEQQKIHVMGRIIKRRASFNPAWDFHIDPATTQFFEIAIEVCDATTSYVNDYLDEACGAFLPGCYWCPWTSRLLEEVPAPA